MKSSSEIEFNLNKVNEIEGDDVVQKDPYKIKDYLPYWVLNRSFNMDRGLNLLFRLMSASWVFICASKSDKKQKSSLLKFDRISAEDLDDVEERIFSD